MPADDAEVCFLSNPGSLSVDSEPPVTTNGQSPRQPERDRRQNFAPDQGAERSDPRHRDNLPPGVPRHVRIIRQVHDPPSVVQSQPRRPARPTVTPARQPVGDPRFAAKKPGQRISRKDHIVLGQQQGVIPPAQTRQPSPVVLRRDVGVGPFDRRRVVRVVVSHQQEVDRLAPVPQGQDAF